VGTVVAAPPGPRRLPMFPLSTVLFPTGRLPLQVFEDRYRRMLGDCLAADGRFGVVLIARGSEVGGGDERFSVGTEAAVEGAVALPDGRWRLVAAGLHPVRVARWLDDDPYPLADVVPVGAGVADGAAPSPLLGPAEAAVRRARVLLSELGAAPALDPGAVFGPGPDAAWALCDAAPLAVLDRQRLLEAPGHAERLAALRTMADDVADDALRLLAQR